MHNQFDSQYDAQVEAAPATEFAAGGLFSHPDTDHLTTRPGPAPGANQRTYTDLFQEPADAPENTRNAA